MTSPAESAAPPPLPLHPAARLRDFPDRLSPVLVKELRQGMRTHFFSISFILLQAVLLFTIFVGAANPSRASDTVTGIFWFFAYATLGVLLPLRGFDALSSEIKGETLELVRMTRMGAWGLTLGKWAALTSQNLLFAIGLLPYILIRYYLGGVEVFTELMLLAGLVFASTIATAFVVGMSVFRSVLLRIGIMFALPFVVYITGMLIAFSQMTARIAGTGASSPSGTPSFRPDDLMDWRLVIPAGLFLIYFFLDFGASRLATDAVNFATRKRLVVVGYFVLLLALPFAGVNAAASLSYFILAVTCAALDSLTEAPIITREIMRPFRGMRRPLAYLFAPGWHTAVWFLLLLCGLFVAFRALHFPAYPWDAESWTPFFAYIGTITLPTLLIHLFFHQRARHSAHFGLYVLLQIVIAAVTLIAFIFSSALGHSDEMVISTPLPAISLIGCFEDPSEVSHLLPFLAGIVALSLLLPIFRAKPLYHAMSRAAHAGDGEDAAGQQVGEAHL